MVPFKHSVDYKQSHWNISRLVGFGLVE